MKKHYIIEYHDFREGSVSVSSLLKQLDKMNIKPENYSGASIIPDCDYEGNGKIILDYCRPATPEECEQIEKEENEAKEDQRRLERIRKSALSKLTQEEIDALRMSDFGNDCI